VPDRRMVERWCRSTPSDFVFDVKLHKLLSRHTANVKSLPPALQKTAESDGKGRVKFTPKIEDPLIEEMIAAVEPMRETKKFGVFLLQLSPAFSPRRHALVELEHLLGRLSSLGLVVELRNRNWTLDEQLEKTLAFFEKRQTTLVLVDAPNEKHFTVMPSDLNVVTQPGMAYLRLHGRNAQAYLRGKTVAERFYYDYSDEEVDQIAERAKKLAAEAKTVHVIFNNNALDFAPHAALRLRKALGQIVPSAARQVELFR
ncbi:MAG TPA: DUF72 domain-containing protein, partial [Chthoniobacterales bacterium]|nr:DUF72 domain-containing protein [Chthoniobacterales bacterium]